MKTSRERRANIRFDEDEYARIVVDAQILGETIPGVLKRAYFSQAKVSPKFTKDDASRLVSAVNRIGNNINQIARHLNGGAGTLSVTQLLEDVKDHLSFLKQFAVS